jgi:pimeloyl-ACP methyl ester carboxylesterase
MHRIQPFIWAKCLLATVLVLLLSYAVRGDELRSGYHKAVQVTAETTIDSIYPLANQSPLNPPADWLDGYESTQQRYELFLPPRYDSRKSWPVVIFVSPANQPMGYASFRATCSKLGVIFASPYDAGNKCPSPRRTRIVLDVLDDVRRRCNTNVDRTYIGGFSGGGRVACNIAFALPEYFGGVIPVCAAGELRTESWLRRRCADRLSVALVTGDGDFNRGEVERFRGPMLKDVGVRTRFWVKRGMGHSVPDGSTMTEVFKWLDEAAAERTKLAKKVPTTSASSRENLDRDEQAQRLFVEAEKMLRDKDATYNALMLMKGISVRWPDLPQARKATQVLLKYDAEPGGTWREDDIAEQRLFLVARARGLDRYASGPLAKQYESQRDNMTRAAIQLWQQVIDDGQDAEAVREAKERLQVLKEKR